ncbi:MAG TPA: hypothetical protein VGM90_36575 [Kofleriaceae bacterium]|jgi:hypothetical protein
MKLAAVLVVGALIAQTQRADALCMAIEPVAKVLGDATVPVGGGLLVGLSYDNPENKSDATSAVQKTWKFSVGSKFYTPIITVLAPGLAMYALPHDVTGTAKLMNGTTLLGTLTVVTTDVKQLPAPTLKSLTQTTHIGMRGNSVTMEATLKDAPPADAVALVVADDRAPRNYGSVAGAKTITVYAHGRCSVDPDGTVLSSNGDKLQVYWIDKLGRRSPSTAVKLKASIDKKSDY